MSRFVRGFLAGAVVVLAVDFALQVRKQVRRLVAEDARFSSLSAEDRERMNSPTGPFGEAESTPGIFERLVSKDHGVGCSCDACAEKRARCSGCEDGTCDGEYGSAPWMS